MISSSAYSNIFLTSDNPTMLIKVQCGIQSIHCHQLLSDICIGNVCVSNRKRLIQVQVNKSEEIKESLTYKCDHCDKICKSKRGLSRHINTKHTVDPTTLNEPTDMNWMSQKDVLSLKKFPISKLLSILKICASIVAADMCLPESTQKVFLNFSISLEEANILWEKLRPITDEFNGNAEKFYATFYGLLVENVLPNKFDITTTNILMSEVANHILIYLSDININTNNGTPEVISSITEKEIKCLQYISGYIVHKLHNKFRFSKSCSSDYNRQCVAILQACKIESDDTQTLVNARDRGGLWKVNKNMQGLF